MVWIFMAVLGWGALHSLLAARRARDWAARRFGAGATRGYRLFYNLTACLTFLPVLALLFYVPDRELYRVPLPWSAALVAGQVLAALALGMGFLQQEMGEFLGLKQLRGSGRDAADAPIGVQQGRLVSSGLYRFVRHPLYTAGIAFIWLMPLMTRNILAVNIGLTLYVIIGAFLEERKLRREFGAEYADYAAATPMFIPFLKGNKKRRRGV